MVPFELVLGILVAMGILAIAVAQIAFVIFVQQFIREQRRARTFDVIIGVDLTGAGRLLAQVPPVLEQASRDEQFNFFDDPVLRDTVQHLNKLESISIGIRNGFYDEEILKDFMGTAFISSYRRLQPVIELIRRQTSNSAIYINAEAVARRWESTRF